MSMKDSKAKMTCVNEPLCEDAFPLKVNGRNLKNNTPLDMSKRKIKGDIPATNLHGKKKMIDVVVCAPTVFKKDKSVMTRGEAAEHNTSLKLGEYRHYVFNQDQFSPFSIEAGGHWSVAALKLVKWVAHSAYKVSKKHLDYKRTIDNICQRVAVAVQVGVVGQYAKLRSIMDK